MSMAFSRWERYTARVVKGWEGPDMRWLKRLVWLSIWGIWVWLGFGLYRELPRSLGPLVCQIPQEKGVYVTGFVGDTNRLAFQKYLPPQTYEIKLYVAETGSPIELKDAWGHRDLVDDFYGNVWRGYLFVNDEWDPDSKKLVAGIQCVNLATSKRKRLTKVSAVHVALHDQQQWLAVSELASEGESDIRRVVVIDLQSGRELFSRECPRGRVIERRSFFVPGSDKLVIPTPAMRGTESVEDGGVEIWKIGPPAVMEKFVKGLTIGRRFDVSSTGRIAQQVQEDRNAAVVFDLNEERVVFSTHHQSPRGAIGTLRIARNGTKIFIHDPGVRWDVDSGKVVRRDAAGEMTLPDIFPGRLVTNELWSVWWKRWFPNLNYASTAFRDLETGRLIVRLNGFTGNLFPNRAGTLVATTTGAVHRLPYVINWPLLVLCQVILAIPLVVLWVFLRLLRRRKLRLAAPRPYNESITKAE